MAELLSPKQKSSRKLPVTLIASNSSDSEEVSFKQALRIVRKRYQTILVVGFAIALLTMIVSIVLTPYYAAVATIEIQRDSSNPLDASGVGSLASSLGGSDDVKTQLTTEENILQNTKLFDEVMEQEHFRDRYPIKGHWYSSQKYKATLQQEANLPLVDAPVTRTILEGMFLKHLTVTNIPDTRLLTVTFEDPDAHYASVVTNALVHQYVQDILDLRNNDAIEASQWMSTQLDTLSKDVDSSQQKLLDYEKQSGLIAVPSTSTDPSQAGGTQVQDIRLQRLIAVDQQYVTVEANRVLKEAIYKIVQTRNPDMIANMVGSSIMGAQDNSQAAIFGGLMALHAQEASLKLQLASVSNTFGAQNPHVASLDTQLEEVHKQITDEVGHILLRVKGDYDLSVQAEAAMKVSLDAAMKDAGDANDAQIKLAVMQQQAGSSRMLYQDLYTKLKEAQLTAGTQSSDVDVITPALQTPDPVHPKVPLYSAIGLGGGLFIGLFVAFVRENLDDSVVTSLQVEEITKQAVLGYIPDFATLAKKDRLELLPNTNRSWLVTMPTSPVAESYRALRTSLLLSQAGAPPRTMLVTSCLPGEGKTTTVYNLAVSLAKMGKRVLMMDADMRKPSLQLFAQVPNNHGLSTVLTAGIDYAHAIVPDPEVDGLFFLPSGPVPPNPSELVGSPVFVDLLKQLSLIYDFIVIDSPPTMPVTDSSIMAPLVDGVIIVVRSGITTKLALQRVTNLVQRADSNLLGFVLNGVNNRSVDYYYSKYYGRGHDEESKVQR